MKLMGKLRKRAYLEGQPTREGGRVLRNLIGITIYSCSFFTQECLLRHTHCKWTVWVLCI